MEPTYRLRGDAPAATDFTPRDELLGEMAALLRTLSGELRLGCELTKVEEEEEGAEAGSDGHGRVVVHYRQHGVPETLACSEVILCTGGLQTPRRIEFPGEGGSHISPSHPPTSQHKLPTRNF